MQARDRRARHRGKAAENRCRHRPEALLELLCAAWTLKRDTVDAHGRPSLQWLWHLRQRRQAEDAERRRHVIGRVGRPVTPSAEHAERILGFEEQRPARHLEVRKQPDLDRGDDRIAAAAAAQRVEQLAVMVGIDASHDAVRRDDFERAHVVDGESVAAPVEREPAAEQVADHADAGARAVHRREAVPRDRVDDVAPARTRLDVGDALVRVDVDDSVVQVDLQQERVLE